MDKVMFRKVEELPLVLTPAEISGLLGISRNTAYELLHSKDFPAFRIGKTVPGEPGAVCGLAQWRSGLTKDDGGL